MKKFLAGLLAALMLLSAMPMTSLAAQAEEWTAAVESAVVARETADAPNSFGAAVKNTVQSLGRFLQDTVTRLVQQNLQESSAVAQCSPARKIQRPPQILRGMPLPARQRMGTIHIRCWRTVRRRSRVIPAPQLNSSSRRRWMDIE